MEKKFIYVFAIMLFVLSSCEPEVQYVRKTYVDRTLRVNNVLDPINNTPWLQQKYLAFQEDSTSIRARALFIIKSKADPTPRIYEYRKTLIFDEFDYYAALFNSNGTPYALGTDEVDGLISPQTALFIDSIIQSKVDMVKFPPDSTAEQKRINMFKTHSFQTGLDTILNSAHIDVLSCSVVEEIPL